jgi:glutamine amidotransferase
VNGLPHKIPHIGWNKIVKPSSESSWQDTILENIEPGSYAYFIHSFTAIPVDESNRLADSNYNGRLISACVQSNQLYGCQFHPEKSGKVGLQIIKNLINIKNHCCPV